MVLTMMGVYPEGQRVTVVDEYIETEDGAGLHHGDTATILYEDVDGYVLRSETGGLAKHVKENQIEAA